MTALSSESSFPAVRPLPVTAGLILRETPNGTRVLIARRKLDTRLEPGKWEFPGGKIEPLEHPKACLAREIREELDLAIEVDDVFDVVSHVYESAQGPVHILLLCYLCRMADGASADFKLREVADARWVSGDELGDFDYAAADIATVEKLRQFLKRDLNSR